MSRFQSPRRVAPASTLLLLLLLVRCGVSAQSDITLWSVPTEGEFFRDGLADPTPDDIVRFFRDPSQFFSSQYGDSVSPSILVADISNQFSADPEFARQVLGQRLIFRSISSFIRNTKFSGRVHVRFFGWTGFLSALRDQASSADGPHIISAPSTWIANLKDAGVLVPLDVNLQSYEDRALDTTRIEPGSSRTRALGLCGGIFQCAQSAVYALPWLPDFRLFYFWKADFPGGRFTDRSQFISALREARQRRPDLAPFAMPTAPDWDLLHEWTMLLSGEGSSWGAPTDFLPQQPSENIIRFLDTLHRDHLATFVEVRRTALERQFVDHKIGSMVAGPWLLRQLTQRLGLDWHTQIGIELPPFNVEGHEPSTFLGGVHLGLTPRGQQLAEAHRLMVYMTREALRDEIVSARGATLSLAPFALADQQTFGALKAALPEDVRQVVADALERRGLYPPRIPEWATTVEDHATHVELFYVFKAIAENEAGLAYGPLADLRNRLNSDIYGPTRVALLFVGIGGPLALVIIGLAWVGWRRAASEAAERQRIRVELDKVETERVQIEHELTRHTGALPESESSIPELLRQLKDVLARQEQFHREIESQYRRKKERGAPARPSANAPEPEAPFLFHKLLPVLDDARTDWKSACDELHFLKAGRVRVDPARSGQANRQDSDPLAGIIGISPQIVRLKETIRTLAMAGRKAVLILGERGTGKELIASALHELSSRKEGPFLARNCAGLVKTLADAQIFGTTKNIYNDAPDRAGLLEGAHRGTLFLDEIGELPEEVQTKLLRVLEEKTYGKFGRLGEEQLPTLRYSDFRLISATSRAIENESTFRPELFDRLGIVLEVPPLRDRREDIPLLAEAFLKVANLEYGKTCHFEPEAMESMTGHSWPDNVRGLKNCVENAVIFAKGDVIDKRLVMRRDATTSLEKVDVRQVLALAHVEPYVKAVSILMEELADAFPPRVAAGSHMTAEPRVENSAPHSLSASEIHDAIERTKRHIPLALKVPQATLDHPVAALRQRFEPEPGDPNVLFLYLLWESGLELKGRRTKSLRRSAPGAHQILMTFLHQEDWYPGIVREIKNHKRTEVLWEGVTMPELAMLACELHGHRFVRANKPQGEFLVPPLSPHRGLLLTDKPSFFKTKAMSSIQRLAVQIAGCIETTNDPAVAARRLTEIRAKYETTHGDGQRWRSGWLLGLAAPDEDDLNVRILSVWVLQLLTNRSARSSEQWNDRVWTYALWDYATLEAFGLLQCDTGARLWNLVHDARESLA